MRRLAWLVPLALLGGTIAWTAARPVEVTVSAAVRGPAIEAVYATGTVEADPRVEVKAKVSGTVAELLVKEGDRVRAGQLLLRLDNQTLRYDLERARADLRAADRRTSGTSPQLAALKAARDSVGSDAKLAAGELGRAESLVAKGAMARDELDRRRERVNKLTADQAAAEARVASMEIDLRVERERMGAQEGSIHAQNADTEIRAPLSGTIIHRRVELGEAVAMGQTLLTVGNTDHLLLEIKIDEADVGRVRVGQQVLIDLDAYADRVVLGRLAELYPDADRDTKTFRAKVEIPAPPEGLRSGMSAEVNVVTARHENAVLVPAGAVAGAGRVFVTDGGRVHARAVKTGLKDPRAIEIVSGIAPGDEVVVAGPKGLRDGQRVSANTMTVR